MIGAVDINIQHGIRGINHGRTSITLVRVLQGSTTCRNNGQDIVDAFVEYFAQSTGRVCHKYLITNAVQFEFLQLSGSHNQLDTDATIAIPGVIQINAQSPGRQDGRDHVGVTARQGHFILHSSQCGNMIMQLSRQFLRFGRTIGFQNQLGKVCANPRHVNGNKGGTCLTPNDSRRGEEKKDEPRRRCLSHDCCCLVLVMLLLLCDRAGGGD
mmetsp:Transcript_2159/g.4723  ORF Transcript_2159/g.4723 Transcript_2159/m.4723 type:complete len:212 (+) Transcript_2159:526-1161(+)